MWNEKEREKKGKLGTNSEYVWKDCYKHFDMLDLNIKNISFYKF